MLPYSGTAQTPCTAAAVGSGGLNQNLTPAISYSPNTNVGTVTVTVSFAGDTNHTGSSNTTTFAISPVAVTALAGSDTWVYNASTETLPACTLVGSFTTICPAPKIQLQLAPQPGRARLHLRKCDQRRLIGELTDHNGPRHLDISQATSTVTMICPSSVVYNGTAQTPCTATVTGWAA